MNNVNYHTSLPTISELLTAVPDMLPDPKAVQATVSDWPLVTTEAFPTLNEVNLGASSLGFDPKALQATVMAQPVHTPNAHKFMLTEEQERELKETAVKFDNDKVDWMILPYDALEEIIKVMEFGARKYARGNFASGEGLEYTRVLNSLMRHILAFSRGEDLDPETGISHMAHAGCNVLFLLHYIKNPEKFKNNDDRATKIVQ